MKMSLMEMSLKCSTLEKMLDHTIMWGLGIIFEPNEISDKHITSKVGNRKVGWILRTFKNHTTEVVVTPLKTFVVLHAEYLFVICMPTSQNSIGLIESISASYNHQSICTTKDTKYLQSTKAKGMIRHINLKSRSTTRTKPRTRN